MRAIEYLMQLYPELKAKEILALQVQDKLDDQKEFERINEKKIEFMTDINTNGGYYRGRFGLDQHYFYRVFDMEMDNKGRITMTVESIVLFCNPDGHKHTVTENGRIHLERNIKGYQEYDKYGLEDRERVTVKEWDAVNGYLDAMSGLFWDKLK